MYHPHRLAEKNKKSNKVQGIKEPKQCSEYGGRVHRNFMFPGIDNTNSTEKTHWQVV